MTGLITAEVCHIRAQNADGLRFDSGQSSEQRHGFDNLVLMCGAHHKVIDDKNNLKDYGVSELTRIKVQHESAARDTLQEQLPKLSIDDVKKLIEGSRGESVTSSYMDFRHAKISAGGQGGGFGGGGGGGGVVQIVGVTPAGYHGKIDGNGKRGRAPGAGGGGAGAVSFVGRQAHAQDLRGGLRVTTFFVANHVEICNNMLYVHGAGWEFATFPELGADVSMHVACMIETASVEASTLIAFWLRVSDSTGTEVFRQSFDVGVPTELRPVMRISIHRVVRFNLLAVGIHSFAIESGGLEFARFDLEIRVRS